MEKTHNFSDNQRLPPFIAYLFLFLIYVSTFRIFATLPLEGLHQSVSTAGIIIFSVYYLLNVSVNLRNYRITKIDLLLWLFILVNLIAAYTGNKVFGQPFLYGLLAQRSVLLSLSGILLLSFLNKGLVTIRQVERSFFFISLLLLLACYFFTLFVDPSVFSSDEFVTYSPIRGYRYRFQFALVVMLLFYSLFKVTQERKKRYSIVVLLILIYMIFFLQSRTSLVVLFITLSVYFYRNYSLKRKVRIIVLYGGLLLVSAAAFISFGYTTMIDRYRLLYNNVLDAFTNEAPVEASSAIRFMEYNTALEYIARNPVLGNGFISSQWKGGYQNIFGYFYPVDIGIMGNIFVYGLIGTFIIYLPYYFSMKMSGRISTHNVFCRSCEYMLLFFFFSMFFSAVNIRDSASVFFLVCLIYYFRFYAPGEINRTMIKTKNILA